MSVQPTGLILNAHNICRYITPVDLLTNILFKMGLIGANSLSDLLLLFLSQLAVVNDFERAMLRVVSSETSSYCVEIGSKHDKASCEHAPLVFLHHLSDIALLSRKRQQLQNAKSVFLGKNLFGE